MPGSPQKRIRRRPEVAEAEILGAADELLQETDFRALTVEAVMSRTGMQRSAFYSYFADCNVLVMRLLGRIENEMVDASLPWLDTGGPPLLGDALDGVAEIYARHGHVLRTAHEASYHDEAVERYYRHTLLQNFMDAVAGRLRAEHRAGRVSVPDAREVAHALLLMNANVLVERLGRQPQDSPGRSPGRCASSGRARSTAAKTWRSPPPSQTGVDRTNYGRRHGVVRL